MSQYRLGWLPEAPGCLPERPGRLPKALASLPETLGCLPERLGHLAGYLSDGQEPGVNELERAGMRTEEPMLPE